jgi:hypothetical protein
MVAPAATLNETVAIALHGAGVPDPEGQTFAEPRFIAAATGITD